MFHNIVTWVQPGQFHLPRGVCAKKQSTLSIEILYTKIARRIDKAVALQTLCCCMHCWHCHMSGTM